MVLKRWMATALCALALAAAAMPVDAQVPILRAEFRDCDNQYHGVWECLCAGYGVIDTLTVVAYDLDMRLSSIEFGVYFLSSGPPALLYIDDIHRPGSLHLGTSYRDGPGGAVDGVAITYPIPLDAFSPVVVMRILVLWMCDDCDALPHQSRPLVISVVPHEGTGGIRAIRWPDYHVVSMYGDQSFACPIPYATEESTWGRVKALYR